jgi:hypothetical protein
VATSLSLPTGEAKLLRVFVLVVLIGGLAVALPLAAAGDRGLADAQHRAIVDAGSLRMASGPIVITKGGVYTGNWVSTSPSTPAVLIATSETVSIVGSVVVNVAGGTLIESPYDVPADLTITRSTAMGGNGRFVNAENFKSIAIRNCTIINTGGIKLVGGVEGSSVVVTRNRQRNVQRGPGGGDRQFIQFAKVTTATIDVSWNEVVNTYGNSDPEDLVSVYHSAHARVHDNYFQHQSKPGNAYNTSSQNGITIEGDSFDNEVWNNQVVDGLGIGVFAADGAHDNYIHDNRIVQDGFLPDGKTRIGNGYRALRIRPGGANNHAHGNVVGYMNRDGDRRDGLLDGAPEGNEREWSNNRHLRRPITSKTELNESRIWRTRLAAHGIRVGA